MTKFDSDTTQNNLSRIQIKLDQKPQQALYIESSEYISEPLVSQKFSEIVSNDIIKISLLNSEFQDISSLLRFFKI